MIINKVLESFKIVWGNDYGIQGMTSLDYYDAVNNHFKEMEFTKDRLWIKLLFFDGVTEYVLQTKAISKFGLQIVEGNGQVLNCKFDE